MNLFDAFDKMKLFNQLVEQQRTGTPDMLAERLGISRSTLYNVIGELRSWGADIGYSRANSTFYYKNHVSIDVHLIIKHLDEVDDDEAKKISGGCKIFPSVLFFGRNELTFAPE